MYRNICLHDVAIFNICCELNLFIDEICFHNSKHKEVIIDRYKMCVNYIDYIHEMFEKFNFNCVTYWQGHFFDSAIIRIIALQKSVPVLVLETTPNKNKLLWDNVSGIAVNQNLSRNYYWKNLQIVSSNTTKEFVKTNIASINHTKSDEHQSPTKQYIKNSSKPLLLFLGQVYTDASILFGL